MVILLSSGGQESVLYKFGEIQLEKSKNFKPIKFHFLKDLCLGEAVEFKRCNKQSAPEICQNQYGECDADGFRFKSV